MPEITPHSLEIYLSYHRLTVQSLEDVISGLARISNSSVEIYASLEGMTVGSLPSLEVETIHTGNSVKFKFGEGWLPTITNDKENDIVIGVPTKLGIPILVGYLLLTAADKMLDVQNKYRDGRIKEMEIQIKQVEVRKITAANDEKCHALQKTTEDVVDKLFQNPDFREFRVNDINILPDFDDRRRRVRPRKET